MNKKNITIIAVVFFRFFILAQQKPAIRTDTVIYSKNTVFLCKWYRLIGVEIPNFNSENFIESTDTTYECAIYVITLKNKTQNHFKVTLVDESPEFIKKSHYKMNDSFTLPCFNDTSSIHGIISTYGWIIKTKVKFRRKRGKCKDNE